MPTTLVTWIHVSDIHFGHGDAGTHWDQRLVLHLLRSDVERLLERGLVSKPDMILVTGDVAFSGDGRRPDPTSEPREYADAAAWLGEVAAAVGLGARDVFVVPGNHDVNRKVDDDPEVARLVRSLRDGTTSLDAELGRPEARARLARRIEGYLAFSERFAPACLDSTPPATPREPRLFWAHRVDRGDLSVRLVGLNTALLSADEQAFGDDRGKLRIGLEQVARAILEPARPDEIVIALSHHPLRAGWLADEDAADMWIRNQMHIHLSGHVHRADVEMTRRGAGGEFVRVTAGAAHGNHEANVPDSHGYAFASIVRDDAGQLWLRVWPREWGPSKTAFQADVDNIQGVDDGRIYEDHVLRSRPRGAVSGGKRGPWAWLAGGAAAVVAAAIGVYLRFLHPSPEPLSYLCESTGDSTSPMGSCELETLSRDSIRVKLKARRELGSNEHEGIGKIDDQGCYFIPLDCKLPIKGSMRACTGSELTLCRQHGGAGAQFAGTWRQPDGRERHFTMKTARTGEL